MIDHSGYFACDRIDRPDEINRAVVLHRAPRDVRVDGLLWPLDKGGLTPPVSTAMSLSGPEFIVAPGLTQVNPESLAKTIYDVAWLFTPQSVVKS
jgi:hypothetical protein